MLLSLRIWFGRWLFGTVGYTDLPIGTRVSPNRMIKWLCENPEVEAMRYIAESTKIPIPKLYKVHRWHGKLAIEMEYVKGQNLQSCWRDLSRAEQTALAHEICGYIQQLRNLRTPTRKETFSSSDGGPCRDTRVGSVKLFGPFDDCEAFHQCIRGGIQKENVEKVLGPDVMRIHSREYQSRFTHGDLGAQNILIRDGHVVAIIDWECAGWYPEYWEYTKIHYNSVLLPEFYEMLAREMQPYEEELRAERKLWALLNQPLDEAKFNMEV